MKLLNFFLLALFIVGTVSGAVAAQRNLTLTLDDLQKAVVKAGVKMPQVDRSGSFNAEQYFIAIRGAIDRGEYSEGERALGVFRAGSFADQKDVIALVDEAIAEIHAQALAKESAIDLAIESITGELRAKIESHAPIKDFDVEFEKLNSLAVPRTNYGYNDNSLGAKVEALRTFISRWQDYLAQTNQGNAEQAASALNELIALSARMPVVPRSELLALQSDVSKLRETQQSTTASRFSELAKRMQASIDGAKTAADLDGFLLDLSKARPSNDYQSSNRVDQMRQFVTKWQEFLVNVESGNTNAAQQILKALANDSNIASIYPRSRLLGRLNASNPAIVRTTQLSLPVQITFENLGTFAEVLAARNDDSSLNDFRMGLNELIVARQYLKNGDAIAAFVSIQNRLLSAPAPYTEAYAELRRKVVLEAAVAFLKPVENMGPKANEGASDYLQRILAYSRDTNDWQLGYSVLSLMQTPGERNDKVAMDLMGYRQLVAAANFEAAGQYVEAVQYYFSSLRSGGANVPSAEVGRRLKTIKESHPTEFEVGERMPAPTLPFAQEPRYRPGTPPFGIRQ